MRSTLAPRLPVSVSCRIGTRQSSPFTPETHPPGSSQVAGDRRPYMRKRRYRKRFLRLRLRRKLRCDAARALVHAGLIPTFRRVPRLVPYFVRRTDWHTKKNFSAPDSRLEFPSPVCLSGRKKTSQGHIVSISFPGAWCGAAPRRACGNAYTYTIAYRLSPEKVPHPRILRAEISEVLRERVFI